ncbi:hypothetical protein [Lusitaniella coriacea]|uniref:hypothetical protein n=1 Tax=Lusitaniella coriacea TaxID=1983105 RepID=UPI003CF03013
MPTYDDILNQVEHLKPDEQLRLIEDLAILVRRRVAATPPDSIQEPPKQNLDRWFGFLPKRIDALEFQLQIRQEWDREVRHEP